MDTLISKFVLPVIIFLLALVFGFWLSNLGKPYNGILFNVHKLAALGAVILTSIQIFNILKNTDARGLPIILLIIAGFFIVALFATGALMSIGKLSYDVALTIHRIAPILLTFTIVVSIYLLRGIKP